MHNPGVEKHGKTVAKQPVTKGIVTSCVYPGLSKNAYIAHTCTRVSPVFPCFTMPRLHNQQKTSSANMLYTRIIEFSVPADFPDLEI